MKCTPIFLTASIALIGNLAAQEQVDGFHGYLWGTARASISELSGMEKGGTRSDGLEYWTAEVSLLGESGSALFFFEPGIGELISGVYIFHGPTIASCESTYYEFRDAIVAGFPDLTMDERIPRMGEMDRAVYDTTCEYFAFNDEKEVWGAAFINPRNNQEEITLQIHITSLDPYLTLSYNGDRSHSWDARAEERDRAVLGPVKPRSREPVAEADSVGNTSSTSLRIQILGGSKYEFAGEAQFNRSGPEGLVRICVGTGRPDDPGLHVTLPLEIEGLADRMAADASGVILMLADPSMALSQRDGQEFTVTVEALGDGVLVGSFSGFLDGLVTSGPDYGLIDDAAVHGSFTATETEAVAGESCPPPIR